MIRYYNESDIENCLSTISTLKTQTKTGLELNEVLERIKPALLDLLESKIPVKTIVKHFHTSDIKLPQHALSKYIASIRPKKNLSPTKTKRKAKSKVAEMKVTNNSNER